MHQKLESQAGAPTATSQVLVGILGLEPRVAGQGPPPLHPDLLPTEEVTKWRAPKVKGLACSGAGCDLNIVTGSHVPILKSRLCEVWSAWPCLFLDL